VPRVVARGRGATGEAILSLAREHGIPIEENAPLAEALAQVEIGEDIPEAPLQSGRRGADLHPARFREAEVAGSAHLDAFLRFFQRRDDLIEATPQVRRCEAEHAGRIAIQFGTDRECGKRLRREPQIAAPARAALIVERHE